MFKVVETFNRMCPIELKVGGKNGEQLLKIMWSRCAFKVKGHVLLNSN